ncbi:hypothetical protein JDV02_000473 [Purpureocillium takamizusanense]|uniref:Uncharacterized protein n=1 Tax=Purpureocillium takamizusanense TaxID=2060973 RepID=A0A9Q8V6W6_9HYPO|nr:uncharacterized protein JDV02_000473 [Purpureocillium takamizusanense]UNI13761.1 hypothetical protein JDV02_000473 [Purpureocillium takamizusanense]
MRRESPMPRNDGSASATPLAGSGRPIISRNTSANTNTAVLRDASGSSPRPPNVSRATDQAGGRKRLSSMPIGPPAAKSTEPSMASRADQDGAVSPGPAESNSTTSSDEDESSPAQSRIIRRPPRFQQQEAAEAYQDEDEDGSEPAFQPYQAQPDQVSAQDLASTLKGDGHPPSKPRSNIVGRDAIHQSQTSDSSAGSAHMQRHGKAREQRGTGPLSPRRKAELAGRSPGGKAKASSREGSDGTPSMGSSFSDLDDASVTQSALEDALASQMNRGAISSRFSISGAFRSRYAPGSNK